MQPQSQSPTAWFELTGSSIDLVRGPIPLRFALLQRGPVRGGVWFVAGRPAVFIPAGQA